ncbi:hypothetical protein A3A60_03260 [Candidatus Curtissbacteria bacterium RIFCSPLOWO2_01_FULL_42_26]|uniref:Uncharacterized protein n=1 Tax=Candidatus Curtissbacteria bacterium RIFCSPLOWO2_01_FULL_42_26 TaxID=1797729 RepID=A0A1F5HZT1_9BACT|nr:MAG: hypothetical protein A3A60_03260 [Candidatus Curtissbacteria bacterium RIFCSPLOWO2_01_FULL_42_26]
MTERNRPEGSFLNGKRPVIEPTFGSFLRNALIKGTLVLGGLGVAAGGGFAVNAGSEAIQDALVKVVPIGNSMPCYGQPVPGMIERSYLVNPLPQTEQAPVRTEPDRSEDNVVGLAQVQQSIRAKGYYGTHYNGGSLSSNGLGSVDCEIVDKNGKKIDTKHVYGIYYRVVEVDTEVDDGHGKVRVVGLYSDTEGKDYFIDGLGLEREFPDSPNQNQGQGVAVTFESR